MNASSAQWNIMYFTKCDILFQRFIIIQEKTFNAQEREMIAKSMTTSNDPLGSLIKVLINGSTISLLSTSSLQFQSYTLRLPRYYRGDARILNNCKMYINCGNDRVVNDIVRRSRPAPGRRLTFFESIFFPFVE